MKQFTIFTCAVLLFVGITAFINDTSISLKYHWCPWCHRLQATVFAKPEFKQWANENVVLLELDFPRRKKLPADIAQQNNELKAFFKPRGYPTIWIFTMNMNEESKSYEISALGNLGYPSAPEGKEAATFIGNANKILAKTN